MAQPGLDPIAPTLSQLLRDLTPGGRRRSDASESTSSESDSAPPPPPRCPRCRDTGWQPPDRSLPLGHPRFGQYQECDACTALAERRLRRLLDRARIPARFAALTWESYPATDATAPVRDAVRAWAEAGQASILLHGPVGVGKTGLAVCALRDRIERQQVAGLFFTAPDMLGEIRACFDREVGMTASETLAAIRGAPLLVIDDLGAERPTAWVAEQLYAIVGHRHDQELPTIVTTNLDAAALTERLTLDRQHSARLAWRILEMCAGQIYELAGPNLRQR